MHSLGVEVEGPLPSYTRPDQTSALALTLTLTLAYTPPPPALLCSGVVVEEGFETAAHTQAQAQSQSQAQAQSQSPSQTHIHIHTHPIT